MSPLVPLFLVTALVYSMAGFGGGSTYLALLVLFDVPYDSVRSIALICNISVVIFGTWHFARGGYLSLRKVMPFVVASIPMAYLGGTIHVGKTIFTLLLGASLGVAAIRMLWIGKAIEPRQGLTVKQLLMVGIPVGAVLGFMAGIVGIGGGIYLAPVLLFLGWTDAKQTAAAASFFILVNSVAGLLGQATTGFSCDWSLVLPLVGAVIIGGQIGSRLGADAISRLMLQRVTGVLILMVSGRLLWGLL